MPVHGVAHKGFMPLNNPPKVTTSQTAVNATGSATVSSTLPVTLSTPTYVLAIGYSYSFSSTSPAAYFGGLAMTALSGALEGSYIRSVLFGLQLPAASIGDSLEFSMTGASGYLGLVGWQIPGTFKVTGAVGTAGQSAAASITVPSGAGQLVVGGVGTWNAPTPTSGTEIAAASGSNVQVMALQKAGASSTVLSTSQTSTYWTMVGATLKRISA
jgi:hypothetical protein